MEYEYVALSWNKEHDEVFAERKVNLISQGWRVYAQACWQDTYTGACIMRRPKEEKMKEECCVEENKPECCEKVELDVLPIFRAYRKYVVCDDELALRLAFIEMQYLAGRALTWPCKTS